MRSLHMVREGLQHDPGGVQGPAPAHEEEAGAEQPHPHRHRPSLHMFSVTQNTLQGRPWLLRTSCAWV